MQQENKEECNGRHCKCMNIGGQCPNRHFADCKTHNPSLPTIQTPDSWEKQFREYFDKMLKPKKPSMGNLDREILVDFIKKQCALAHSSGRREGIELALREIEDAIAEEPSNFPDKQDVVYHVLERVQAEIKSLLDKDLT